MAYSVSRTQSPVAPSPQAASYAAGLVADGGRAAADGPDQGLVYSSATSGTPEGKGPGWAEVTLLCRQLRVKRMQRSVKAAARAIQEVALAGASRVQPWMLTLTYAPGQEWAPRHVSDLLQRLRQWARRRGFEIPYVWVAEMQQRGAVHYHVVVWVPVRYSLPKPDKQGWWRYGMTRTERAKRALSYIMKYATKGDTSYFPRGLRLSGSGGLTTPGRAVKYWLTLPVWVVARVRTFQRVSRLPGGLWLVEQTGEVLRGAWQFVRWRRSCDGTGATVTLEKRGSELAPLPC